MKKYGSYVRSNSKIELLGQTEFCQKDKFNNSHNNFNIFKQDDHLSFTNCYQFESYSIGHNMFWGPAGISQFHHAKRAEGKNLTEPKIWVAGLLWNGKFSSCSLPYREQVSSALFFQYNTQLGPPFFVLVDTNFINFSISNKLDIFKSMMDCLYAKCK